MRGLRKIAAMVFVFAMLLNISLPALGEYGEEAKNPGDFVNNQAHTEVSALYYTAQTQLSVTVPLNLVFAVNTDKDGEVVFPEDSYTIVNKSDVPVKVTDISVKMEDGQYTFVNSEVLGENEIHLTMKATRIAGFVPVSDDFVMTTGSQEFGKTNLEAWTMAAKSDEEGAKLIIRFDGKMKGAQSTWTKDEPHKLFTITYMIEAA